MLFAKCIISLKLRDCKNKIFFREGELNEPIIGYTEGA
jgi:hypothetical protein